jgi:putative transposase
MSWVATTKGIDAGLVGDLMMQAVEKRFGSNGKPPKTIWWLTDNGSCYTAAETRSFAKQLGLKPVTTPVTSPKSNGMAESFVKTLKRDYAKLANRPDSKTVMAQLKDWFDDYNSHHLHRAQCTWLLAANAVQRETIGNLNIPAVLEYRVKTKRGPISIFI